MILLIDLTYPMISLIYVGVMLSFKKSLTIIAVPKLNYFSPLASARTFLRYNFLLVQCWPQVIDPLMSSEA